MHASETKLRNLINQSIQYVVPLFQRPYSWSEKQWKTLWTDVLDQSSHDDGRPHFFGSIVTTPAKSVPQGVGKYLLIDGQQRLTTIQVLLAAIRDSAGRSGDSRLQERVSVLYLTNACEENDERLKILPTQDDRPAFRAILQNEPIPEGKLKSCYQFFLSKLERLSAERFDAVHTAVVDRLSLVSITCDEHDNPHLIFESLNAKGEKLTPADLIRNFLLMRVPVGVQEQLFNRYWLPIQQALGTDLTEFVRHYLMKEGKILKEADVYFELKDKLANSSPAQAEAFLADLHRLGMFYAKFLDASRETDIDLAERLLRIRRLKVTVAYPFLLRVFDAYHLGRLSRKQVLDTLDLLESFVIRRSICNLPSNQLRRMLPPVFDAAGGAGPSFVIGLREQLGGKRCPDDESFAASLVTETLYSTTEKNARLRLILERLERSFCHREPAELANAEIEHVMPQTLTPEWREELGDGADDHWQRLLHTIGNLTLTRYNAELSNRPYAVKRPALADKSHFELNRYFADIPQWSPEAIVERGRVLARLAVDIWVDIGRSPIPSEQEPRPNHTPVAVRFRETVLPVSSWKDAFVKLLQCFESDQPGLLARIASDQLLPCLALDGKRFRQSKTQIGDVTINTHGSATQLRNWCTRIAKMGTVDSSDFAFVMPEDVSELSE